jgi:hypothetical protein
MIVQVDDTEEGDHVLRDQPTEILGTAFNHMSETPGVIDKKPYKEIGEDTAPILINLLGYSKEKVIELEEKGIVKHWP